MPGVELPLFELGSYLIGILVILVVAAIGFGILMLPPFLGVLYGLERLLRLLQAGPNFVKYLLILFRTLQRNLLRTSLTFLAIFVFVFVVTGVWSILDFIGKATAEKEADFKAIVTEKFKNPSGMPRRTPDDIKRVLADLPPEFQPTKGDDDFMTWSFVVGSIDKNAITFENVIFFFAMEPSKLLTMMDGIDELSEAELELAKQTIDKANANIQGVMVGPERLKLLNKKVGDKIVVYSKNYKDLEFECEIIGVLPGSRNAQTSLMNREFLYRKLDEYKAKKGEPHPLDESTVNLIWVKLPNKQAFEAFAGRLADPTALTTRVKLETASSLVGSILENFRDIFWGMRYLLSPAICITMCLVISNAISISVRERRTEMAVLKVLGFKPRQVMGLVLGEAILIGVISGGMSTAVAYYAVDLYGGIKFPIAFFGTFFIPTAALWWGPLMGFTTALLGSIVPAWSARTVKVSEVFSKVA